MGSLSTYAVNKLVDHSLKNTAFTQPSNIYVALSTADPLDSGSGLAEPSGGSYAREAINNWDTSASRATENTDTISFTEATASWGTITHFALMDAVTSGNLLAHGALSASQTIGSGDNASFQAGDIDVSFNTGGISNYLSNKLLDHIFKNTAMTQATNLYAALSLTGNNPGDDGSGASEPSDTYARVNHNVWSSASSGQSDNTGTITFAQATAAWGTVAYFMIFDALTTGNMFYYGSLTSPKAIGQNDTAQFADSGLSITMT